MNFYNIFDIAMYISLFIFILNCFFMERRRHQRTHVVVPRDVNTGINSMVPFSVLGPTRLSQADLWEAMMNVNNGNRIRSLRYLSGMCKNIL